MSSLKNLVIQAAVLVGATLPAAVLAQPDLLQTVPAGTRLVIADDANYSASLLRLSGEQDKLVANVTYANFTSGPLRLEAIRAGAAQVGVVGDVPPILAHFSGANVVIVGAAVKSGPGNVLATSPGSGIQQWSDLKGKRVGINVGTAQQAILLRNLAAVGLAFEDIRPVNLGVAEFADALRADQIDAAVLKQPDRARYLATVAGTSARALDNAPGANAGIQYLYAAADALRDPAQAAAIREFVVRWYRGHLWKNGNREAWIANYLVRDQRLSAEDAATVWESDGDATRIPGLAALVPVQQQTIDLLQAAGQFKGKKLIAEEEFDLRFSNLAADSPVAGD